MSAPVTDMAPTAGQRRLGGEFGKLWTGTTASAVGDGLALTAAPLMAASLTSDPRLIAGVSVALTIPYALFGIPAGVLVDRLDRRTAMARVDLFRAVMVAGFAALVMVGQAGLPALYACFFLIGSCETFFRNASQSLVPSVVPRDLLVEANGRLIGAQTASNQFVGPLAGAALFALAPAVPFGIDALTFVLSAAMLLWLRIPGQQGPDGPAPATASAPATAPAPTPATAPATAPAPTPGGLRALLKGLGPDMTTGTRWLFKHRLLRNLALMAGVSNLVGAGAMAVLVVYAHDRLGLGSRGYGVLLACEAVGAVLASRAAPLLVQRIGKEWALVTVAVAQIAVNLVMWRAGAAWVAGAALALGASAGVAWDVVVVALRQTLIPDRLQGRVNSVYRLIAWGCIPIGAALAGVLAAEYGVAAVYGAGSVVMALVTVRMVQGARTRWITAAEAAADGAATHEGSPA